MLPFQDYSEDRSLDYFADGLTEDLITDLSRWKELRVIARNTSMAYKGQPVDIRDAARETDPPTFWKATCAPHPLATFHMMPGYARTRSAIGS